MAGVQCPEDCPLRTPYTSSQQDEPLPSATISGISQAEVASKLYSPIKDWQTRILVLKETANPEEIAADLVVVDLIFADGVVLHESQEKVQFVALSYTWGVPVFNRKMIVNGIDYSITESLYSFLLRYQREENAASRLWVDALCINQHDPAEKALQVSNMIAVYKKAKRVVAWLGEHTEHTIYAMDYLHWWKWDHYRHSQACEPNLPALLEGLQDLCHRPWVHRVWIRQEVWAAKAISMLCGSKRGEWEDFKHGVDAIELIGKQLKHLKRADSESEGENVGGDGGDEDADKVEDKQMMPLEYLSRRQLGELAEPADDEPRFPWVGHRSDDLLAVVKRASNCLSTEPRDRIYALLGMSRTRQRMGPKTTEDDTSDLDLRVDYTRPVSLVYQDLARYVMRREQCVSSVLCLKGKFGTSADIPGLPSWTPDWRFAASYEPYVYFDFSIRGEKEELHVDSSDSSEDEWLDQDEEGSVVSKDSDGTTADGSLRLTSELRTPIIAWHGPLEDDGGVLPLQGVVLAELVADLPQETNDWLPVMKFKGKSIFVDSALDGESTLEDRVWKIFSAMSIEERKQSKEEFDDDGKIVLRPKKNKKKKPIVLRPKDIEFRAQTRDVVPVRNSDHFKKWEKEELWEASVKYMSVRREADTEVPLAAFRKCRLARRFRMEDKKKRKETGAKSDDEDSAFESVTASSSSSSAETLDERRDGGYYDNASDDDTDDSLDPGLEDYSVEQLNEMYNKHFVEELAVPKASKAGDIVVVVAGSAIPLILRKLPEEESSRESRRFTYVGPAVLTDQLYNPKDTSGYDLWCYHRPQRSLYAHFQVLLQSSVRAKRAVTFNVV